MLLLTELPRQLSWLGLNHIYNTKQPKHLNQSITNQMNALKCRTLGAMRARTLKMHTLYNVHACFPQEIGGPYVCFQRSSAGSLQRSSFRENPTNFLTFVACWVRYSISGQKDAPEVRCGLTDRQTDRQK